MIPVLTAEDVRRQDAEAAARGIPVEQLMENAGWAVARAARNMLEGTYGRRVVVVCGKGNNGGDGLVAARRLLEMGAHVTVVPLWPASSMNELARTNLERFRGSVRPPVELKAELQRVDLVIDAIFGVGLTRAPEGEAAAAIETLARDPSFNRLRRRTLAVDVPSGVDSDTGQMLGLAVVADATVTFEARKPAHFFSPGRDLSGVVTVAPIGLPPLMGAHLPRAFEFGDDVARYAPIRVSSWNKRKAGTVLVIAGSEPMPGAAALSCGAAVHAGAGLTTLMAPERVCLSVISRTPEITTIPAPATEDGTIDPKALDLLDPDRFGCIVMGPGLTTNPRTAAFVRDVVASTSIPLVLDADGLNAFVGHQDQLAARGEPLFLTPHAGELARLMGRSAADLDADRLTATADAADRFGCVVVFKGLGTVIAGTVRDGLGTIIDRTGSAALAQGGTGDVLAGMLGAFVAFHHQQSIGRRLGPLGGERASQVAAAAVWLHGRAADRISQRLWPHPANASALIDEIGPTLHEVMSA